MPLKSTPAQRRADQIKHKLEMRENSKHRKVGKNMKYMNNHYGNSKIFPFARCKMPMKLQFFAESAGVASEGAERGDGANGGFEGGNGENTPSVEELLATIAQKDADYAKLKNTLDKKTSELSSTQKQLKTKMSAEEQLAEEEKKAREQRDAEFDEMKNRLRMMDYSKRYMGVGMDEKTAESLSELTGELPDPDKFFSALGKFMEAKVKSAGEDAIQDLIKKNPEIKAGTGDDARNSLAEERAVSIGKRTAGANEDILKHYRR